MSVATDLSPEEKEYCRQQLRRIAWRLQYKARVQANHEFLTFDESLIKSDVNHSIEDRLVSQMRVVELLNLLPSVQERFILKKIILEGFTEKEIASQLHISQQAVSKWKRKSLNTLRMILLS